MPITPSDFILHPAEDMTQTNSSGGIMNWEQTIASGLLGYVISDIYDTERVAGGTRHYKLFQKVGNIEQLTAREMKMYLDYPLAGDIVASLIKGNFTNTWADVAATRKYGCGNLKTGTTLAPNDQTLTVVTKGSGYGHFANGDTLVITDLVNFSDTTGKTEMVTIDQAVTYAGNEATIHFTPPLKFNYADSRSVSGTTVKTRIASVAEYGDVKATATVQNKVSASGTYVATEIALDHLATVTQTFTLTFNSATAFTGAGNTIGSLPSGSVNSTYEPINDTVSRPLLSIPSSFWTGTWATGDSLQIVTQPCAAPFFLYLYIPTNTTPQDLETLYFAATCRTGSS